MGRGVEQKDAEGVVDRRGGVAAVLADAVDAAAASLEDAALLVAPGFDDGAGNQAILYVAESIVVVAVHADGAAVGVGGGDHHVCGRDVGGSGDEGADGGGGVAVDADEVAGDDGGLGGAVVDDESAGVEVVVDADGAGGAGAVALEEGADGRGDDDLGGAGEHGRHLLSLRIV